MRCYFCGRFMNADEAVSVDVYADVFEPTDPPEREWICYQCNAGEGAKPNE